jgi:glucose-1-phosphate thymidylyltransferase
MKALILCGGKGTRLRPLTYTRSKQLLPVGNKPIVEYVLQHVDRAGIKEVGVILAPETQNETKNYFDRSSIVKTSGIHIKYILQDAPMGLAHTVKIAHDFLGQDSFVMCLGDNLMKDSIVDGIDEFNRNGLDAMIFLKEVEDPRSFGVALIGSKGEIKNLEEKPKNPQSNLAMVGFYIFSARIHDAISRIKPSARGELEITDAIQELINMKCKVQGRILTGWWLDTGKKDDMLSANTIVLDDYIQTELRGSVDATSKVAGRVSLGEGSIIVNSVVRGPVIIGANTRISDSFIGPYTSIGNNADIKNSSIEHCVILDKVTINGISRLEDSLIGEESCVANKNHKALKLMIGDSAIVEV